ncbi:MAG: response regulator [Ghiorsea sp.]|nr:response regulator [Ghiorsea sp.]
MADFDLSNFLASFFDEARERLSAINQALVAFESGSLNETGLVALRRDAHTIKGSALMLGVNDIGKIAHVFEDMVESLIEHSDWQKPVAIQFLYDLHDLLEKRLADVDNPELIDTKAAEAKYTEVIATLQKDAADLAVAESNLHDDLATSLVKEVEALNLPEKVLNETSHHDIEDHDDLSLTNINIQLESAFPESKGQDNTDRLSAADAVDEETVFEMPLLAPESAFRPKISAEDQKVVGERKSSGRFLRVDAERLEALSHHIIEMSTVQSSQGQRNQKLKEAQLGLRLLRREWQQMRFRFAQQPSMADSLKVMDRLIEDQLRKTQQLMEESRFQEEHQSLTLKELRDQVLSLMLRPLDSIFATFPRAVRDIANKIGKRVNLVVDGKSVEMDQGVAESLVEPLIHLLNNAVAHGIEDADERERLGKPKDGQVTIIARQNGSEVQIEVMDDGRGIDPEFIRKAAVKRGVTTQDEVDLMDSAEVLELIFRPGFSTLTEVDEMAGRGIGMNIVQDAIRKLTGSIKIHSEVGQGARFTISVPISIAVQEALMFKIGAQRYGMLTHLIEQAIVYNEKDIIHGAAGKRFLKYNNHQVPIVDLRAMMYGSNMQLSDTPYIIVAEHIEGFVGIMVDELLGDGEVVVHDLDPYVKRYQPQGLMGNTIVEDGSVMMLLEPYGIKEMGRTSPNQAINIEVKEEDKLRFNILLVDDSLIAREVEKKIFESLGFVVETAIDGMDALEKLEASTYDMVVTDLEMPRLDGFGLVRQIRNQPKYEDLPIMVISTRESSEDRLRALEAGADSYLVKQHLDAESIVSTVKALVGPLLVQERGIAAKTDNPSIR